MFTIHESGVFVPEPVRLEPLNRLIRPYACTPASGVHSGSPTMRSSLESLSIFPAARYQPNRPFTLVLLNGASVRLGVVKFAASGEKYTYARPPARGRVGEDGR